MNPNKTDADSGASHSDAGLEREAEILARKEFGDDIDWSDPVNLGATAMQRAWFRIGYKVGVLRPNS